MKTINEGYLIDQAIAIRIIYLLTKSFEKWPAFKDGLIDKDGKKIRNAKNSKERENWTMLHRLVARLKRIIGVVPGGKSFLGTLTASYLLMRECVVNGRWDLSDQEMLERYRVISESCSSYEQEVIQLLEDVAASSTANISTNPPFATATGKSPVSFKMFRRNSYKKRNQLNTIDGTSEL